MFQTKVLLIKWTIKNNAIVGKFNFHANMCSYLCIEEQIQHLSLELMFWQMVSLNVDILSAIFQTV